MEKTIEIGGRSVPFKTNGIALLIYKSQTGRDLIPDIVKTVDVSKIGKIREGELAPIDVSRLDMAVLYDICWVFAKIASPGIPPVMEWLEGFEAFPVIDVFKEVLPLLMECITCSAEIKNTAATAGKRAGRSWKQHKLFSWQRK